MDETRYPVFLNLKIPWLANIFFCLFNVCLILLILLANEQVTAAQAYQISSE